MKKVKITVLKTAFYQDLADSYGVGGLAPCSIMQEGQVFYADRTKPDGFCDGAWRSIYICLCSCQRRRKGGIFL